MIDLLQWAGCATGIIGSLLLALRLKVQGWGFVLYVFSNACWIAFGIATKAPGLIVMQCAFMATSLAGVWNWLFLPYRDTWRKARLVKENTL
jgi:hypothetical protein